MPKLEKKHRLIFSIFSLLPIIVCIISLFLPLYSKTDWDTGETWYFNSFMLGLDNFEMPDGYLLLAPILLTMIPIILIIFIDNVKYINAIYAGEVILWGFTGGLMLFGFIAFAFVGSDTLGFRVIPQIGYYLRHISWFIIIIPLLYMGVILFLNFRNNPD